MAAWMAAQMLVATAAQWVARSAARIVLYMAAVMVARLGTGTVEGWLEARFCSRFIN